MLWARRPADADGATAPVDLRTISGLPGRLSFPEGISGSRMTHVPCTVRKVDHADILLELPEVAARPQPESAVILEVATGRALLQCFTSVRTAGKGPTVILRTPARPHVVQRRRFPRVDLFLGITLHTPDRPIEDVPAQMINLSLDGAACVMAEPLQPDTELVLNFTNLGFHPPEVDAVVRRCSPSPGRLWIIGFQFQSLLPEHELYLGKYLSDYIDPNQAP
ncbi:MAG TPA: PilZ domain-containing protein [Symbiobacteriaceae bacterium]|nr:PilZ domain-containing protein [Symbiobacteriaceae bacterium]